MFFLMGLNDTYAAVRGQILLMDPIPSLSNVFSLPLQDEKQRKVGKKFNSESSALAIKNNGSSGKGINKGKSARPQCTHCEILGHVVEKCYKLHGYSPGYKFKNKGQQGVSLPYANNVVATDTRIKKVLVSLEQNINNFLTCSILRTILVLKHHKILLLMHIGLLLSSLNHLWIFKGMRC
ncbi:hypothetical protein ACB092_01G110000 [Castanea dentata]